MASRVTMNHSSSEKTQAEWRCGSSGAPPTAWPRRVHTGKAGLPPNAPLGSKPARRFFFRGRRSDFANLLVSPTGDSDICTFLITPMHLGELRVNVELTRGDVLVASRALRTEATPSDRKLADASSILVPIPLSVIVRPSEGIAKPPKFAEVSQPAAHAAVKRSRKRALGITNALAVIVAVLASFWLAHQGARSRRSRK